MSPIHVILVSGWSKPDLAWRTWRKWWDAEGVQTSVAQARFRNFGPIQAASRQLMREIEDKKHPPVLVGHSCGGLIIRHCLAKYNPNVAAAITLAAPLHGTPLARMAPWSASAMQMVPGSNFLRRLEVLPEPTVPFLSVKASLDLIVRGERSLLGVEDSYQAEVPQSHVSILFSRKAWELVNSFAMEVLAEDLEEAYEEDEEEAG